MFEISVAILKVWAQNFYHHSPQMFVQQASGGNTLPFLQRCFALSFYIKIHKNSAFLDMNESGCHL